MDQLEAITPEIVENLPDLTKQQQGYFALRCNGFNKSNAAEMSGLKHFRFFHT